MHSTDPQSLYLNKVIDDGQEGHYFDSVNGMRTQYNTLDYGHDNITKERSV